MDQVRALLVSDRVLARVGLRAVLTDGPEIVLLGEAASVTEAVELALRLRPSVVVIDAMGDSFDVIEATTMLMRRCQPAPGVLVLANQHDHKVQKAIQAGANGLVLARCSPNEFLSAVRLAAAGYRLMAPVDPRSDSAAPPAPEDMEPPDRLRLDRLTDREFEVMQLVARGYGNAEISEALNLSESTVKSHIRSILVKLGLRNRVHTVIYAYEIGFVRIGANPIASQISSPAA